MEERSTLATLSQVCSRITDGSHFSPREDTEGAYPMLSVKDMMRDGFDYSTCKYINEKDYQALVSNGCQPLENDVLVAKDGSYLKTAFVQKEPKDQVLLSSIAILRPKTDVVSPDYLAYFFKAPRTKAIVERHYLTGTAIKRVILKGFKEIKIPILSLPEQERVVRMLDLLSSIIDKLKEQLDELNSLTWAFYNKMFCVPSVNKKGWTMTTIGSVIAPKKEIHRAQKVFSADDNIQYIDISSIDNKHNVITSPTCYAFSEAPSRAQQVVKVNDILVSLVRPNLNNVAVVQMTDDTSLVASSGFCVLRALTDVNTTFLFFSVKSQHFIDYLMLRVAGANYPAVREEDIKGFPILLPPLHLQQVFERKIQAIENQKQTINKAIKEAQTLFDYTLDKYFG